MSKTTRTIIKAILITIALQIIPFYLNFLYYGVITFGDGLAVLSGTCVIINGIIIGALFAIND